VLVISALEGAACATDLSGPTGAARVEPSFPHTLHKAQTISCHAPIVVMGAPSCWVRRYGTDPMALCLHLPGALL
jgi:hypothetical protein